MADNSAIEWTDATWNPIRARNIKTGKVGWHCEHATTGCEHCYSEGFNKRLGTGLPFKPGHRADIELFLDDEMLTQPLRWKKPRMIFVCSMTDLFAEFVPDEWIDRMFAVMALCPQHTFQVLTKRSARMRAYLSDPRRHNEIELAAEKIARGPEQWGGKHVLPALPLANVWLGVSTERQQEADERIPDLLKTPAAIRFVSIEPLLGPVALDDIVTEGDGFEDHRSALECDVAVEDDEEFGGAIIDWVIVGGESGPKARPMYPGWVRSLRDQCKAAGTAFFMKQWGEHSPAELLKDGVDPDTPWRLEPNGSVTWAFYELREPKSQWPDVVCRRVGKKLAGRRLDGIEHNAMPEPRQ